MTGFFLGLFGPHETATRQGRFFTMIQLSDEIDAMLVELFVDSGLLNSDGIRKLTSSMRQAGLWRSGGLRRGLIWKDVVRIKVNSRLAKKLLRLS